MQDSNEEDIVIDEDGQEGEDALKRLREKLKVCVGEKQEYLEGWQRLRADFANEKRESAEKILSARNYAFTEAAEKILPLVDAFDLAFSAPSWNTVDASWKVGIERLREEVLRALKDLGVEAFIPKGELFDPASMTASREVDGESGKVIEVDRVGFKTKDAIIRPAYVAVGK